MRRLTGYDWRSGQRCASIGIFGIRVRIKTMATDDHTEQQSDDGSRRWTTTYIAVVLFSITVVLLLYLFSQYFGA